jgi:glycosyltransferase involved in cell wall biosynthesis
MCRGTRPNMNADPNVSVVIATRNRWPLLAANALPRALGQPHVELGLIVVDDGSTDETPVRLREVDDPRVRVVTNETSLRLPAARNAGAKLARGEWLAFLDDDDLWSPHKLRAQLDAARAGSAAWVYGRAIVVDACARVLEADPFPAPEDLPSLLLEGNWIPGGGSNVMVRVDAFRTIGGFDEGLRFFEDWDLWLRLLPVGLPAACDEVVVARVEHGHNMAVRDRAHVMPAFDRLLGKHKTVTNRDRLTIAEWLAYEQYRAGKRGRAALHYLRAALTYRSVGNVPPAIGALLGDRGMRAASRLLLSLRGASHVESAVAVAPPAPDWLKHHRCAA